MMFVCPFRLSLTSRMHTGWALYLRKYILVILQRFNVIEVWGFIPNLSRGEGVGETTSTNTLKQPKTRVNI